MPRFGASSHRQNLLINLPEPKCGQATPHSFWQPELRQLQRHGRFCDHTAGRDERSARQCHKMATEMRVA